VKSANSSACDPHPDRYNLHPVILFFLSTN
jgi:hypothetical protein